MSGMPGMYSPMARRIMSIAWWFERRASRRFWATQQKGSTQ